MKLTSKLMIVFALTLALGLVGINVWAAPSRQGTVPLRPDTSTLQGIIPVTGDCYEVTLVEGCDSVGSVTRFSEPERRSDQPMQGSNF